MYLKKAKSPATNAPSASSPREESADRARLAFLGSALGFVRNFTFL